MPPTPRPIQPQLTPEGLKDEDRRVPGGDETSTADPAEEDDVAGARPFGNLTENLTTRWNVESR